MLNYAEFMELANKVFCILQANDGSSHMYYKWRLMSDGMYSRERDIISLDDLCDIYHRDNDALAMIEVCENWYRAYANTLGSHDNKWLTIERDYMRDCFAHSLPEVINNPECYKHKIAYQIALILSLVDDDTRDRLLTTDPIGVILAKWFFGDINHDIRAIIGEPDCYQILRFNAK